MSQFQTFSSKSLSPSERKEIKARHIQGLQRLVAQRIADGEEPRLDILASDMNIFQRVQAFGFVALKN